MHKYPFIILFIIIIGAAYLVLFANSSSPPAQNVEDQAFSQPSITPKQTDYTASFLIFTNGTKRIFTASMYHNLSTDSYIQNPNPAIIHVKSSNITWKDFFSTLPMGLSSTCLTTGTGQAFCDGQGGELRFFVNGEEMPEALKAVIQPKDKLLITFGNAVDSVIQQQYDQIPDPITFASPTLQAEE